METIQKPRGGRPKGSRNKAVDVFIRRFEKAYGMKLHEIAASCAKDPKLRVQVTLKLMAYRYGEPPQHQHVEVDQHTKSEHSIRFVESPRRVLEPEPDEVEIEAPKPPAELPEKATNGAAAAEQPRGMRPSSNRGLF